MIRNSVIVSALLSAMATCALVFASAGAEEAVSGHEAAIKAARRSTPRSR